MTQRMGGCFSEPRKTPLLDLCKLCISRVVDGAQKRLAAILKASMLSTSSFLPHEVQKSAIMPPRL